MNNKITIGIFNDSFYPMTDGVISVIDNLAKRLVKYANVIVFVPAYSQVFDDSIFPYQVVRCKSVKISFLDYSLPTPKIDRQFRKTLNKYKLDIVHIHSPFSLGIIGLKYAKKHNIPCLATMHSQFKLDFKRAVKSEILAQRLTKKLIKTFNKCDDCFAVNAGVAELYYKEYKYKKLPKVMNNATEMTPLENSKIAYRYIAKKYKIKGKEKVFLFVGRINILKNILFIVDALKAVKDKDHKLKFKMLFVGSGNDEDKLKKRIKDLDLEKNIILCGKVTDREELKYYYARADLFLFPSIYDASSIVQIEAASQSTPCLFLKDTVTASTIKDNINGFLAENSVGDYSDRIIEIIHNKNLYKKVAKNSYYDLYRTWDDCVEDVYNIYLEYIKNNNNPPNFQDF